MKIIAIILSLFLAVTAAAEEDWQIKERAIEAAQIKLWEEKLEESTKMQGHEKVDFLALGLRNMAYRKTRLNHSPQVEEMYTKIQTAALAVPGYAGHYRDRINAARTELDEIKKRSNSTKVSEAQYRLSAAQGGFGTMCHLPSVESVRIVGEFLSDDRGKVVMPNPSTDDQRQALLGESANSYCALLSIQSMPILSKPFKTRSPNGMTSDELESALAAWRAWYEQVKAGNRTFRFEGDPTEYDLNGPASKDKLVRIERDQKRDAERSVGHKKATTGFEAETAIARTSKLSIIAWILAAAGLCAAAVWYFLRGRKVA